MASPADEYGDQKQIIQEDPKMDDKTSKILIMVSTIACVVAVVALILAVVGVANNAPDVFNINSGGSIPSMHATGLGIVEVWNAHTWKHPSGSSPSSEDKIWMFQIGHFGANTQYLDESTGTIRGYDADVVNAVCQVAGKNCRLVWDLYERCWDNKVGSRAHGGEGLMGGWYDACIGWYQTLDRARTFDFTNPIEKSYGIALFTKAGRSFTWPNFGGLKVGFLDGWWIDEHCLARYAVNGFDKSRDSSVIHYNTEEAATAALINNEIQVAFLPTVTQLVDNPALTIAYTPTEDKCANGGPSVMVAKHQDELKTWFNKAFDDLVASPQYNEVCSNLDQAHGALPGQDPGDICVN